MNVEILTVGTELLTGRKADAHGPWLSSRLLSLGIGPRFQTTVTDIKEDIKQAIVMALSRSDLVIICGGLGPTSDDLTREAAAEALGLALKEDPQAREWVEAHFKKRNRQMPENNLRQALVPETAQPLANPQGTAPGLRIPKAEKTLFLLPGPPHEMHAVFEGSVLPWLMDKSKAKPWPTRTLMCWGLAESAVDERLRGLAEGDDPRRVAMLAHGTYVEVRLSAPEEAELAKLLHGALERLGESVFSSEGRTVAEELLRILSSRKATLALAESCTGGRLAAAITAVPGASQVLLSGLVTYSNESKMALLEVPAFVLKRAGAVSQDTALAMAVGLARKLGADYNLAVTGIAGPDGGSAEKPVGLVYIALAGPEGVAHQEYRFLNDSRQSIQARATMAALMLLYRTLCGLPSPEEGSDRAALPRDSSSR